MEKALTYEEAWGVITHRIGEIKAAALLKRCQAEPGEFHVIAWNSTGATEQRSFAVGQAIEAGDYALALQQQGYTVMVVPGMKAEPEQWEKPSMWEKTIPW